MTSDIQASPTEAIIVQLVGQIADLPRDEIDVEDDLLTSGLIDSIGIVRLIADLEAKLGVVVPAPDLVPENFRTIQVMTTYLDSLKSST